MQNMYDVLDCIVCTEICCTFVFMVVIADNKIQ